MNAIPRRQLLLAIASLLLPAAALAAEIRDLSFDDLKFDVKKGAAFKRSMLTDKIERLEGKRIRLRGYILPSYQQDGITQFVLVRDNMQCCFGPGAALFDCVVVEMAAGKSTSFTVRPVTVDGVFRIKPLLGPDGKHLAVYQIDGQAVK